MTQFSAPSMPGSPSRRIRVDVATDAGIWSLVVDEQPLISGARAGVLLPPLDSSSESDCCLLRGLRTEAPFDDGSGHGRLLTMAGQFGDTSLDGVLRLREYADLALCTLELELTNTGREDAFVQAVLFGETSAESEGGITVGAPASGCSVVASDYWFGVQEMHRLDRVDCASPWWFTALADRESKCAMAMGVAEAANVEVQFHFRRRGDCLEWRAVGDCSPGDGRPLRVPPGQTFRASRVCFCYRDNVFEALEAYAGFVGDANGITLLPAYGGRFTGYSSDPELKSVIVLNQQRVADLLAIVRDKLQPFGLDTIKIEFQPYGSPDVLNGDAYSMEDHFPGGALALTDGLRAQGFRPALQSRTFAYTKAGEEDEEEKVKRTYRLFTRDWGFEYLMLDFNHTDLVNLDDTRPRTQCFRDRFRMIREAVGPEVFIEACMIAPGPVIGLADGFRPSHDFRGGNEDSLLPGFVSRYFLQGRVFQLDTEFCDPALWPFVWADPPAVSSLANVEAWVGLCGLLGYSFLAGGCLEHTSNERWRIFTRALPPTGRAARPLDLLDTPQPARYALRMSEGQREWWVVGLFNWDPEREQEITVALADSALGEAENGSAYSCFDFFLRRYVGTVRGTVTRRLPPRSCAILHLTPESAAPVIIGSDRHVTGAFVCDGVEFDAQPGRLTGAASAFGGSAVSLWVLMPECARPVRGEGCEVELTAPRVLRITIPATEPAKARFAVDLAQ